MKKRLIISPKFLEGLAAILIASLWMGAILATDPSALSETSFYTGTYDGYRDLSSRDRNIIVYLAQGGEFHIYFGSPGNFFEEVKPGDMVILRATDDHMIVSITANGHNYMSYGDYYEDRQEDRRLGAIVPALFFLVGIVILLVPPIFQKEPLFLLRESFRNERHPHRKINIYETILVPPDPSPHLKAAWEESLRLKIRVFPSPLAVLSAKDMIVMIARFRTKIPRYTFKKAFQFGALHGIPEDYYNDGRIRGSDLMLRFLYQIKTEKGIPIGSDSRVYRQWALENNIISNVNSEEYGDLTQQETAAMIFRCWPEETER